MYICMFTLTIFKAKLPEARLTSCIRELCLLIRFTYSSLPLQTAPIKLRRSPNEMCNRNTRWHGHSGGPHVGRMLGKTGLLWFNSSRRLQMGRGSTWGMLPVVNESTDELILVHRFRDSLNLKILHLQLLQQSSVSIGQPDRGDIGLMNIIASSTRQIPLLT